MRNPGIAPALAVCWLMLPNVALSASSVELRSEHELAKLKHRSKVEYLRCTLEAPLEIDAVGPVVLELRLRPLLASRKGTVEVTAVRDGAHRARRTLAIRNAGLKVESLKTTGKDQVVQIPIPEGTHRLQVSFAGAEAVLVVVKTAKRLRKNLGIGPEEELPTVAAPSEDDVGVADTDSALEVESEGPEADLAESEVEADAAKVDSLEPETVAPSEPESEQVATPAAVDPAAGREKLAVMALQAHQDMTAGTVETLNEVLLNAFHRTGKFDVIGSSDIVAMLTLEQQRQQTGQCDESCLAEIGGALGVSLMAAASVGAVGEEFVITVKLVNVEKATVLNRVSQTVSRNESALVEGLERAVYELLGMARPTDQTTAAGYYLRGIAPGWAQIHTGHTVKGVLLMGAFVGSAGFMGWAVYDYSAKRSDYEDLPPGTDPSVFRDRHDASGQASTLAYVSVGLLGAVIAANLVDVLFFSTPEWTVTEAATGVGPAGLTWGLDVSGRDVAGGRAYHLQVGRAF